jgi:hypothetical protein
MSVSIISDVEIASSDTAKLAEELRSARAQNPAKPTQRQTTTSTDPNDEPRFRGKSREEVMNMYQNLERHTGKIANDLGQTQRAVQELIIDKRARDLNANGVRKPVEVNPAELLQRPTEALDPFIEERVNRAITPLQQQLQRMEQMLGQSVFNNHHQDANDVMNSPEFATWAKETPLRRSILQLAANGNIQASDELLSEFKSRQAAAEVDDEEIQEQGIQKAKKVSLEQSRSGNDGTGATPGKRYTRSQMRHLMQSPAYEQDEVLREEVSKAYVQGRVVGD